jgi:hypothetical protein
LAGPDPRAPLERAQDAPLMAAARWVDDVPAGPWRHRRSQWDGALLLEDQRGEPLAQLYAGYPLARYLEAVAPIVLFADRQGGA